MAPTDDEYARTLSHLKAAAEHLKLADHYAQNDSFTGSKLEELIYEVCHRHLSLSAERDHREQSRNS